MLVGLMLDLWVLGLYGGGGGRVVGMSTLSSLITPLKNPKKPGFIVTFSDRWSDLRRCGWLQTPQAQKPRVYKFRRFGCSTGSCQGSIATIIDYSLHCVNAAVLKSFEYAILQNPNFARSRASVL